MKTFSQFACEAVNVANKPAYKQIFERNRRTYESYGDWGWISPKGRVYRPTKPMQTHLDIIIEQDGFGATQALEKGYIRYGTYIGDDSEICLEFLDSRKARDLIVWYLHSLPLMYKVAIYADFLTADDIDKPKESSKFESVKEAIVKLRGMSLFK